MGQQGDGSGAFAKQSVPATLPINLPAAGMPKVLFGNGSAYRALLAIGWCAQMSLAYADNQGYATVAFGRRDRHGLSAIKEAGKCAPQF